MTDNPYSGVTIFGGVRPGRDIAKMLKDPYFDDDDRIIICFGGDFPPLAGELWIRTAHEWKRHGAEREQ